MRDSLIVFDVSVDPLTSGDSQGLFGGGIFTRLLPSQLPVWALVVVC